MKFSPLLCVLSALFPATTLAQYLNQTGPFALIILSPNNATLNGTALASCHEGAAIESLCTTLAPPPATQEYSTTYVFNYSSSITPSDPSLGTPGYVTYLLVGGNFQVFEPLGLSYNPSSNVAVPLFYPSTDIATTMAFNDADLLNIQSYVDDSTSPPTTGQKAYYRWYVCITNAGYTYQTLAWVQGSAAPQNPTCQKVDVKRVFY